jgi:hypothetical protein
MTLVVAWIGVVEGKKPASVYIASDSRITWINGKTKFDNGRKVFGFKKSPDIMGYCGDVLFPSIVLNQVVEMADSGMLFNNKINCHQRFEKVRLKIQEQFDNYPNEVNGITSNSLKIIFASRENRYNFSCYILEWKKGEKWQYKPIKLPEKSDVLTFIGSGEAEFKDKLSMYRDIKNPNSGTSRAIFHCFCDVLENIKDISCGGAPQLVGIYNIENGRNFGIISKQKRYLLGAEVTELQGLDSIEWRNELFERCDGKTMKIIKTAQRQPNPLTKNNKEASPHRPQ